MIDLFITKTQKMHRQPVSTKCVADGMSDASLCVFAVNNKQGLKTMIDVFITSRKGALKICQREAL